MQILISKFIIHQHMNLKFGIMTNWILATLESQSISCSRRRFFKILLWWKTLLKNIRKIAYSKITYTLPNDKNFNIKLKGFVILKKEVSFNLYQLNWELLKYNILCNYYSKRIAKKKKTRLEKLENMLNFPRNNLIDSIKKQQYDSAKFELYGIYDSITEGTKLRSRCKQYKEEKNQVISL